MNSLQNMMEISLDILQQRQADDHEMKQQMESNIAHAQSKQKKNYDARNCGETTLQKGDKVVIKNPKRIHRMGGKLKPRWIGPYVVREILAKSRLKLYNESTKKLLKNIYHASSVKLYTPNTGGDSEVEFEEKEMEIEEKINSPNLDDSLHAKTQPAAHLQISRERRHLLCKQLKLSIHKLPSLGKMLLSQKPHRTRKVVGDGNCFFRCICNVLTGNESSHLSLRDSMVHHMQKKSSELSDYLSKNIDTYLNESGMEENGVWATDAEIMAGASLLETDIIVFSRYGTELK